MKPDLALIEWQMTMLRYMKTLNTIEDDPFYDVHTKMKPLNEQHFVEIQLEPISHDAQFKALTELSKNKELHIRPNYKIIHLEKGGSFEDDSELPLSYTVGISHVSDIDNLIEKLEAERLGKINVHVEFEVGSETIAMIVNNERVEEKLSTWKGCILKALHEVDGQANNADIAELYGKDDLSPTANFIPKEAKLLNSKIYKLTGIKQLLKSSASTVRLNKTDYNIIQHN